MHRKRADLSSECETATKPPLEVQTKVTVHILRLVPDGAFTMGSDDGDVDEKPVHAVEKFAFYLGKFPVTNLQCEKFDPMYQRSMYSLGDDHPVTCVTWEDAGAWGNAARGGLEGARHSVYDKSPRCADRWCSPPDVISDCAGLRTARTLTDILSR